MERKLLRTLAVLALIALAATTVWASGGTEEKTIKIGVIFPLTGEVAPDGMQGKNATMLAVEELNAAGGLLGRKVELVIEDDAASAKGAVSAAQKLVDIDGVQAIIGSLFSSSIIAFRPVTDPKKIPVVAPMASHPNVYSENSFVFSTSPTTKESMEYLAEYWFKERKLTKLATFNGLTDAGVMNQKYIAEAWKKQGGEVVAQESFTPGGVDFRTALTKIKAGEPQVIWLAASFEDGVKIVRQMAEIGLKSLLTSDDQTKNQIFLDGVGDYAEGMVVTEPARVIAASAKAKQDAYKKAFSAKFGMEPNVVGVFTYDCCQALFAAIKRAGTLEGDAVRKQLAVTDFEGVSGQVKFLNDGRAMAGTSLMMIKDRKYVPIDYKPRK
jgi:branched-chain amino acid transport system substrate-binding protein